MLIHIPRFTYRGRMNRKQFILFLIFSTIFIPFIVMIFGKFVIRAEEGAMLAGLIIMLLYQSVAVVRRLHDMDRHGAQYWFLLIPLFNFYVIFLLLFKRGTDGPNRFDTLDKREPPVLVSS